MFRQQHEKFSFLRQHRSPFGELEMHSVPAVHIVSMLSGGGNGISLTLPLFLGEVAYLNND